VKEEAMCYFSSISVSFKIIEDRFGVRFVQSESFQPVYSASAFTFPALPVISSEDSRQVNFYHWGLIPFWVKGLPAASEIREKTLNARAETVFEKPAFRTVASKRCLVPADGFFEWRHLNEKTYPYYIRLKDRSPFALAGLWDRWINPETQAEVKTFSIITTRANALLEKIHNTQKRMPVILTRENEKLWIEGKMDRGSLQNMLQPYDAEALEAYPISRMVRQMGFNTDHPEILERQSYPELVD
jgi:putative SOS response-associated peptidase YedK